RAVPHAVRCPLFGGAGAGGPRIDRPGEAPDATRLPSAAFPGAVPHLAARRGPQHWCHDPGAAIFPPVSAAGAAAPIRYLKLPISFTSSTPITSPGSLRSTLAYRPAPSAKAKLRRP
nr:hypothetical protein [Tanacetum cinerariifolium]